ncbi:MAG: nucleotidyltransferase domain-containing protein [Methanobacteriota archaeon]|nr:MAG: nucleotidyltransferase domain-containing protein [Euryarchaeota archaeon]
MAIRRHLTLAKAFGKDLRRREGQNLVAFGVFGSVGRGEERRHSDVDILVVVKRKRPWIRHEVRDGIALTVLQLTPADAKAEVTGSRQDLDAALGGWASLKPLYDPTGLLRRLKDHARHPDPHQFREAAYLAFLEAFEDVGKVWNAVEEQDVEEAREMAIWFSTAAAGALFNLYGRVLTTGRRAFIEIRRYGELGTAIRRLRYTPLSVSETHHLSESIWGRLLDRAEEKGLRLPSFPRDSRGTL